MTEKLSPGDRETWWQEQVDQLTTENARLTVALVTARAAATARPDSARYYECHVTIAPPPVGAKQIAGFESICEYCKFRPAKLLMQRVGGPDDGRKDAFATSRHVNFETIERRMRAIIVLLRAAGFQVVRFKIEDTLLDSKLGDA